MTPGTSGRAAPRRTGVLHSVGRFVAFAPDVIVCTLLVAVLVTGLQLVARSFHPWATLAVALLGGPTLGWRLFVDERRRPGRDAVWSLVAIVVSAAVTVFNATVTSQWLYVTRDPGFYTVAAKWLTEHTSPLISRPMSPFGSEDRVAATPGFIAQPGHWEVQSSHLTPALVAIVGKGGDDWLLAGNTVLGLVALVAVYAAARRVVGPAWGVLPVAALGCSLPFAAFTRGVYTEPLALAVGFGALALTLHWLRHRGVLACVAAGLLAGASAMVRVDGLVQTIALVAAVALASALRRGRHGRPAWGQATLYILAACATAVLGWLELRLNAHVYVNDLGSQVRMLQLLAIATVVATALLAVLSRTRWWASRVAGRLHPRWGVVAAAGVIALMVLLAARPLFWQGHALDADSPYARLVGRLQAAAHQTVDPTRSYDERSVEWLTWYLGLPAVVLGTAGLAVLAHRAVRRGSDTAIVAGLFIGGMSALYLTQVSITPDQIWASRRFLPVIFPGFLLCAAVALRWLAGRGRGALVAAAVLAVACVALPAAATKPLARTPETTGWLEPVQQICPAIRGGRVMLGQFQPYASLAVTLRAWCDVPVAPLARPEELKAVAAADPRPLYVLTLAGPRAASQGVPLFLRVRSDRLESSLYGVPEHTRVEQFDLVLRRVTPSALVALQS